MRYLVLILLSLIPFTACNSCMPLVRPGPAPAPTVIVDAGPSPAPVGDAAPISDGGSELAVDPRVRLACDNLASIPCAEGMPGCYSVLQKVTAPVAGKPITNAPIDCLGSTSTKTKADARACGAFIACP